jgi:hypothetical protein
MGFHSLPTPYCTMSGRVAKPGAKKALPEFVTVIVAVPLPRIRRTLLEIEPTEPLSNRRNLVLPSH